MNGELRVLFPQIKTENTFVFETRLFTSKDRLILAPMQDLTDYRFRNAYDRLFPNSIDRAVTPFISITHGNLSFGKRKYRDVIKENNSSKMEIIPQVMGNDIEGMVRIAEVLLSMGYSEMNWNLGCPFERTLKKDRGAGLLKDTSRIERIIEDVVSRTTINLSLKLRLGVEDKADIYRLIPIINALPIKNIIIHPRLAIDKYDAKVDLDCFEDILSKVNKRVVYNGVIFSKEDFNKLKLRFPTINDWMIGRGILFNPLLPFEIKSIEYFNKSKSVLALHSELLKTCSSVNKMKEYWSYFSQGLNIEEDKLSIIYSCETLEELDEKVRDIIKEMIKE
jgi:tRNA-dihydrouridine synthase